MVSTSEEVKKTGVAIDDAQLVINNDHPDGNRAQQYVNLALGFLSHLGYAHFRLGHAVKICNCHFTATIVTAAAAVQLLGLVPLAKELQGMLNLRFTVVGNKGGDRRFVSIVSRLFIRAYPLSNRLRANAGSPSKTGPCSAMRLRV